MRTKLYHILFWCLVAGIWFYLRYQDYSSLRLAAQVTVIKVIDLATKVIMGHPVPKIHGSVFDVEYVGVKAPQFSFTRLDGADPDVQGIRRQHQDPDGQGPGAVPRHGEAEGVSRSTASCSRG